MSSIEGDIFYAFSFPKAYFQNIKASEGIREGEWISVSWGVRSYSVLSIQFSCLWVPFGDVICKEIFISIIYNIIIYIDITFFLPFLMVSHTKVTQLNTEYWVTSNEDLSNSIGFFHQIFNNEFPIFAFQAYYFGKNRYDKYFSKLSLRISALRSSVIVKRMLRTWSLP